MAGSNWKGDTPTGITAVVRSSTSLVTMGPRIFMDDAAEDQKAIQPVLSQIDFYPLSQFDGKMKITDWSKLPHFKAPESKGKGETEWVNPETFFDQLPAVMKSVPPLPGEEALYKWNTKPHQPSIMVGRRLAYALGSQIPSAAWLPQRRLIRKG